MGRLAPLKKFEGQADTCCWCGTTPLPKRRRNWCSAKCVDEYLALCPTGPKGYVRQTLLRDQGKCVACQAPGHIPWPPKARRETSHLPTHQVDHIIPVIEGGSNESANLRTLCEACHKIETAKLAKRRAEAKRALFEIV